MAAVEAMAAVGSTAVGFTAGLANFMPVGFMAGLADFTGDLLDFPMAGFTAVGFTLTDFRASGSTTMASTAAASWPRYSVGCGWAPGRAGLIILILTKATTATDLILHTILVLREPAGILPLRTAVQRFRPTDVGTCRSCSRRLRPGSCDEGTGERGIREIE